MRRLGLLLIAAVALLVAHHAPASATTILEDVSPVEDQGFITNYHSSGLVNKFYQFDITEDGTLTLDLHLFGKINVTIGLFNSDGVYTPDEGTQVLASLSGGTADGTFTYSGLLAGTYFLSLAGFHCSCSGLSGVLQLTAATPIPAALLMFLTALGGMGFFGWRRKGSLKSVAQAA